MHSNEFKGSFFDAIGPILQISQWFGLMPADGVNSKNILGVGFRWKSLKSLYSLVFVVCGSIEAILCVRLALLRGMTFGYSITVCFQLVSVSVAIFQINLASKWRSFMEFWYQKEKVFLNAPYGIRGWTLKQKIRFWTSAIIIPTIRIEYSVCKVTLFNSFSPNSRTHSLSDENAFLQSANHPELSIERVRVLPQLSHRVSISFNDRDPISHRRISNLPVDKYSDDVCMELR